MSQSATAPAPAAPVSPAGGADLAAAFDQLDAYREAARSARPEMTLRHSEFGTVHLRLEAAGGVPGEWRALISSRDPGFVPAVQAALAERAIAASSESAGHSSAQGGGHSGGRGGESAGFGGQGSGQAHYGSSPGFAQGSSSPYSPQIQAAQGSDDAAAGTVPDGADPAAAAPGGGLFA